MLLLSGIGTALLLAAGGIICYSGKRKVFRKQLEKALLCMVRFYRNTFKWRREGGAILRLLLIIGAFLMNGLLAGRLCWPNSNSLRGEWLRTALMIGVSSIVLGIVYLLLTYLLMSINSMHQEGSRPKDQSVTLLVLGQYFIISLYSLLFLVYGGRAVRYYWMIVGLLGLGQLLNLAAFIKIITPPEESTKSSYKQAKEKSSFGRSLLSSLLLMLLAGSGMYLASCYTAVCFPGSYSEEVSLFDLLYYTAATLSTVGCGDIVPTGLPARAVGFVIMISGPAYITLLLGKVISMQ